MPAHGKNIRATPAVPGPSDVLPCLLKPFVSTEVGGLNELRRSYHGCNATGRYLRRPHPQGRETGRDAGPVCRPDSSSSSTCRRPRRSASKSRNRAGPARATSAPPLLGTARRHTKTRHRKWPSETEGRNGSVAVPSGTRRLAPIIEWGPVGGDFGDASGANAGDQTSWLRMQSEAKRSRGANLPAICDLQGEFEKLQGAPILCCRVFL